MCINYAGTLLATASYKGTLIRIWSLESGEAIQEVRRGTSDATIISMSFDMKSKWLAVSSTRTTIHVFTVTQKHDQKIKL